MIEGFSLFANVPPADCKAILSAAHEKHFSCNDIIFAGGDPVRHVIMLLSGSVKVTQMGLNGNEIILHSHGAGEIFGSFRVLPNSHYCSTAQAVQPCAALVWESVVFAKLLARIPMFRRNTVRALEDRLLEMEQRFREVSTEKVGSRLSSELVRLSDRLRRGTDNGLLEITLSRAELAQLSGTSRGGDARRFWRVFLIFNICGFVAEMMMAIAWFYDKVPLKYLLIAPDITLLLLVVLWRTHRR